MRCLTLIATLTCLIWLHPHAQAQAEAQAIKPDPDPAATRLIAELELSEGATPMASHPGWRPRRVVVSLPPNMSVLLPGFEQQLRLFAGPVELVFDHSVNLQPDASVLAGADAIIGLCTMPTMNNVDASLIWLHSYTVGMDRCAGLADEQLHGRLFTNSKRLSSPAIAEHAIAMMLSLARGLPTYQHAQAAGKWDRALAEKSRFGEIQGKTLLVAGLGGIGTQIARRANGLGMHIIATRYSSTAGPDYVDYVGRADELGKLVGQADVVVNALPLTENTAKLFNQELFQQFKPGALFINVGRGETTVTADLVAALESGRLYGAGLDVTDPEPLPPQSPLWLIPNVIITPHVSGAGRDSIHRTAIIAAENLRRYVAGEPLLNIVDMRAGY